MTEEEFAKFLCDKDNHCETCKFKKDPEQCELVTEPTMYWLSTPVYTSNGDIK